MNKFAKNISASIKLIRIRQWIKNLFVFAPLVFAAKFLEPKPILHSFYAFLWFCAGSSFVYVINDILDIERDRRHPVKSEERPLASGDLSIPTAFWILAILFVILITGFFVIPQTLFVIGAYILMNIAYSFWLKRMPVIDIFIISIGFVLRVYAGSVAIDVPLSSWMFITTLSLALFLAAMKRRQELERSENGGRAVLAEYSVTLLERFATIAATGCLIFYSLFVLSEKKDMAITVPFVIYGLFRYWFIVDQKGDGESPTKVVLSDYHIAITVILWIISSLYVLYPEV